MSRIFEWKRALPNETLDEEFFQKNLTEGLTIENSNIVINLAVTIVVLEDKPPSKVITEVVKPGNKFHYPFSKFQYPKVF